MIVALTVWEDRISPMFDVAAMILLAEIENGEVLNRRFVPFNPGVLSQLAEMIKQMDVSTLICGAISEAAGGLDEVLEAAWAGAGEMDSAEDFPGIRRRLPDHIWMIRPLNWMD